MIRFAEEEEVRRTFAVCQNKREERAAGEITFLSN